MGLLSRIARRAVRQRRADGGGDPMLTRGYWEKAAAAPLEQTVHAICDGYTCEQFKSGGGVHFDESELGADAVVLDLACGMGRTCRHVAGLVKEYHGVDFAAGMVERAREHNRGVPNAMFHANDGATLGGFADGTFDVVYSELAFQHMPKDVQRSYAAEAARVLREGGRFFAQLSRAEYYKGAEHALTEDEARSLLSPFASVDLVRTEAYWLARGVAGGGKAEGQGGRDACAEEEEGGEGRHSGVGQGDPQEGRQ